MKRSDWVLGLCLLIIWNICFCFIYRMMQP